MNLTTDPWIPALDAAGRRKLFSLQDLFARAHELRDLAAKPHERIALMRLLLCITQAALDGPEDEDDWADCQARIQPAVRGYLEKWQAAFELFGKKQRFLQTIDLKAEKKSGDKTSATKLDVTLASGNNATLFDNAAVPEQSVSSDRAALNLLTFQCFTPSEIVGAGIWDGVDIPKRTGRQAPCSASSMVHTILTGANVCETIWLNLFDKVMATDIYGIKGWGKPIWEQPILQFPEYEARVSLVNATSTYLGRLVPQSRLVLLEDGNQTILLVDGVAEYRMFDDPKKPQIIVFREPHATYTWKNDQIALLRGDVSKSLWRELSALVAKRAGENLEHAGPPALIRHNNNCDVAIWVGGLVTTKEEGIVDSIEGRYLLPKEIFEQRGRMFYEHGVEFATKQAQLLAGLHGACSRYRVNLSHQFSTDEEFEKNVDKMPMGEKRHLRDWLESAKTTFWTNIEQHLPDLLELPCDTNLVLDLPNCSWGRAVRDAAFDAYEQTCPRQTPRQIEAYALGLRKFTFRPKPVQPPVVAANPP